jgi:ABC-type transport system substrate-binding protein
MQEIAMKRRTFLGTVAAGAVLGHAAQAQKSNDTLRFTTRNAIPDVDPYRNSLREGIIVSHEAWDGLVYRDPTNFKIVPLLATAWEYPDPTTIDFTLRPGVKFHNGDPFTADDVVYTEHHHRSEGGGAGQLRLHRGGREARRHEGTGEAEDDLSRRTRILCDDVADLSQGVP